MNITKDEIVDTLQNNSEYHSHIAADIVDVDAAADAILDLIEEEAEEEVNNE